MNVIASITNQINIFLNAFIDTDFYIIKFEFFIKIIKLKNKVNY